MTKANGHALKIEDGVPLPSPPTLATALRAMEIGQSLFVPGKSRSTVSGSISNVQWTTQRKFTGRAMDGGVRIWRTA